MKRKKILALGLAAVTALSSLALTGCGGGASSDTSFTMWIYQGADAQYYTDYAENPVNQYLTSQTWGEEDKKVSIEYWGSPCRDGGGRLFHHDGIRGLPGYPGLFHRGFSRDHV